MEFLRASWGFDLMIGGLFVILVILMILDGPAQRRDSLRREDEQQRRASGNRPLANVEAASIPKSSGTVTKS
jgi:hypothetical protein